MSLCKALYLNLIHCKARLKFMNWLVLESYLTTVSDEKQEVTAGGGF